MPTATPIARYLFACFAALICGPLVPVTILYVVAFVICALLIYPIMILFVLHPEGMIAFFIDLPMIIIEEMRGIIGIDIVFSFLALPILYLMTHSRPIKRYLLFPFLGFLVVLILGIIQGLSFFQILLACPGGLVATQVFALIVRDVKTQ